MVFESFFDAFTSDVLDFDTNARSSSVASRDGYGSGPDEYAEEHFADRLAKIDEALAVCDGMLNSIYKLQQQVYVLQNLADGAGRPELDRLANDLESLRQSVQSTKNELISAHQLLSTASGKTDAGIKTLLLDIQGTLKEANSDLKSADRVYDRLEEKVENAQGRGSTEV